METPKTTQTEKLIPELQAEIEAIKASHIELRRTVINLVHTYLSEPPHTRAKVFSALDCLAAGVSLVIAGTQPDGSDASYDFFANQLSAHIKDDLEVAKQVHAKMDELTRALKADA